MKKKVKLITTFASLGLALALMVFGVYAAYTASFAVTTQVTFKATAHVKATVKIEETPAYVGDAKYVNAVVAGKLDTNGEMKINVDNSAEQTGKLEDITLKAVELTQAAYKYSYKVTITNDDAENDLKVTATKPNAVTGTGYTVEFSGVFGEEGQSIESGTTNAAVFTVTVTVTQRNGTAVDIINADLGLSFVLDVVPAA